jgi:hypothetical protein
MPRLKIDRRLRYRRLLNTAREVSVAVAPNLGIKSIQLNEEPPLCIPTLD